jgi:hypothetical protein
MTHLRERTAVECPLAEADARLDAYFEALRSADGVARVRLRVPVDGPALGVSLDREVRIEAARARDERNLNDLIRIAWRPEGKAVFPHFEGTLVTWASDTNKATYIELEGEYAPPFGAAGQVFDEAIGHRLAQLTAREFLSDIKRAIELPPFPN